MNDMTRWRTIGVKVLKSTKHGDTCNGGTLRRKMPAGLETKQENGTMTPPKDCQREQTFKAEECAARSTTFQREWKRYSEVRHNE